MFINIHLNPKNEQDERFDTLISPSGTIATLLNIEKKLGIKDRVGLDEAYLGYQKLKRTTINFINEGINAGKKPIILFTILIYNAEKSIKLMKILKKKFGNKIIIVVGGQLVPWAKKAYLNNKNIDSVCIGDAEVIIPQILIDLKSKNHTKKLYQGWLHKKGKSNYSMVSYDNFYKIKERMKAQKKKTGISQLTIQGVGGPGCAWASSNPKGPCYFCALQNITNMSSNSLKQTLLKEKELEEKFQPDRIFDVANQFFPTINVLEIIEWLKDYRKLRKELKLNAKKYAYLTVSSVNSETAKLLKEIGTNEVYLGVDHFHNDALSQENKPYRSRRTLERCLDSLKKNDINFRIGVVLGAAIETRETLKSVEDGIEWLLQNYTKNLNAVGIFPVDVLPGSKLYKNMKREKLSSHLFQKFQTEGYLTRQEQKEMSECYINAKGESSPEQIYQLAQQMEYKCRKLGTMKYSVDKSPHSTKVSTNS